VWQYLKKCAEPLEDDPNSVLRRILLLNEKLQEPPNEDKNKLEKATRIAVGRSLENKWGKFYQKGRSQLVFKTCGMKVLCRFSCNIKDESRWFWGVSKKYWANWDQNDNLALVMIQKGQRNSSYLLLNSQESLILFKKCSESKLGEKKINMRFAKSNGRVHIQEWQELDLKDRLKPLNLDLVFNVQNDKYKCGEK
jgi:hypothetical protein